MISRQSIDDFLAQEHIAFVGVSREPGGFANTVYRRLRDGGRTLYPVNLQANGPIEGDLAYATLREVPDPIDGVIVMVPHIAAASVVHDAVTRGIPRVWLHRGLGQSTVDPVAVEIGESHGIVVIAGACPLMFDEPVKGIHRLHRIAARHRISA